MESMDQLRDLLRHELNDLYSAEEQIIEALPAMIEKAKDRKLKKALQDHLKVTEMQKDRLDEAITALEEPGTVSGTPGKKSGLMGLFSSKKCKGMQGLIAEGKKIMGMDMKPDVMDAAIIACAQKIEHYEISGYGTARAYAEELELNDVVKQLKTTLDEEYEADNLLTQLGVSRLNKEAVPRRTTGRKSTGSRNKQSSSTRKTARKRRTGSRSRSRS